MAALRILVAYDGSSSAEAALATSLLFPWPSNTKARGIVALDPGGPALGRALRAAMERGLHEKAEPARRRLAERWPDAQVVERKGPPAEAIIAEARRYDADVIVLGWRGHGAFRRMLAGSVSREVVSKAEAAVLVARKAPRALARLVVGFDASPSARRALRFVSRLEPRRDIVVVLASVVEPLTFVPPRRLPASVRGSLHSEISRVNRERLAVARRKTDAAASLLKGAGWRVKVDLRSGAPLEGLLLAAHAQEGSVLVVGTSGSPRFVRVLDGSVSQGALNNARVPLLLVP